MRTRIVLLAASLAFAAWSITRSALPSGVRRLAADETNAFVGAGDAACPISWIKTCGATSDCGVQVWGYWSSDCGLGQTNGKKKAGPEFNCGTVTSCGKVLEPKACDWTPPPPPPQGG